MSTPTKSEHEHHDRVARLGCIACLLDGVINDHVSIHHTDGRTKRGAHMKVLALCAGHHQNGTGEDKSLVAVHPYKARFEAIYGTQEQLVELTNELLNCNGWDGGLMDSLCRYVMRNHLFGETDHGVSQQ